jgi:microcystin-dependent protein
MIMLWSGSTSSVPSGWKLCNGSSGTPDLRDRFVVGAGSSYDVNATGGSKDAVAISHSHSASTSVSGSTSSAGNHRHAIKRSNSDSGFGGSVGTDAVGSNYVQSEYAGEHKHSISVTASTSVNSAGSSGTDKNLPPYYALAYIMKV